MKNFLVLGSILSPVLVLAGANPEARHAQPFGVSPSKRFANGAHCENHCEHVLETWLGIPFEKKKEDCKSFLLTTIEPATV